MDVHVHTNVTNAADASSCLEAFTRIAVYPKSSHYHTFGCPEYIITKESETGRSNKWECISVLHIYMGPSPQNEGSTSLVLNPTTGNALPQFHVGHDDLFETARYNRSNKIANRN